jgi:hypothetical protein
MGKAGFLAKVGVFLSRSSYRYLHALARADIFPPQTNQNKKA